MLCKRAGRGAVTDGRLIGSLNANPFQPDGSVTSSFWDIHTSGQPTSAGGIGKTTAEMQTASTFLTAGWDFADETANGTEDLWRIIEAFWDYPRLAGCPWPTYGGGTGEPNDPYLIFTAGQMRGVGRSPKHVKLMADIDLAHRCFSVGRFSGVFDGNGHTISNFTCTGGDNCTGLFTDVGQDANGRNTVIKNLGLIDPNIQKPREWSVGCLVNYLREGTVKDCYVSGGSIAGYGYVGGLVGFDGFSFITDCYSTADVTGDRYVGGLAGGLSLSSITRCSAMGRVTGLKDAGGLVPVSRANVSTVTACFWDVETTGQSLSAVGIGLITAEMQTAKMFLDAGWDFVGETVNGTEDIWWIAEGQDYPRLWWEAVSDVDASDGGVNP